MPAVKVVEKKLGRERAFGQAIKAGADDGSDLIEVDPRQSPREYMDTVVHEAIHIADPVMPERKVAALSRKISRVMWQQRFRKVDL